VIPSIPTPVTADCPRVGGVPLVEIAERPGAVRSDDRVVVLPHAVVLLDGATSLVPTERDGGWYATQLAEVLRTRLTAEPTADLATLLADAIAEVATRYELRPGASPSSTVALLRWDTDTVEALVLADSPVVVFTTSGVQVVSDDRLARVPRPPGGYRERLRAGGGYGPEHHEALLASAAVMSRWRNTEGGFWVAEADPAAAHQAVRARWPRAEVEAALLASDGVSCGVDDYGLFDWSTARKLAESSGPQAVLDAVRAAEESDPDGRRWPRPKRHDDQSLVLVRFDENRSG